MPSTWSVVPPPALTPDNDVPHDGSLNSLVVFLRCKMSLIDPSETWRAPCLGASGQLRWRGGSIRADHPVSGPRALRTIENASPSEQLAQHRSQNVGVVVRPRRDTRPRYDFVPSWPKRKVAEIGPPSG